MHEVRGMQAPWVLVVEDEARLREQLRGLLAQAAPDFGPVHAVGSAEEALELCEASMPSVVFLDIRLPGRSGMDVAGALAGNTRIVFVTAHDHFSLKAFEYGAVDYLLKPVSQARIAACIERLRKLGRPSEEALHTLLRSLAAPASAAAPTPAAYLKWLAASTGRRTYFIAVDDIVFLKSDHKYTRIVCRDGEHLIEESLKQLLTRLDPTQFRQVHRSAVVNVREILLVEREEDGGGVLKFRQHGEDVRISPPFMRELRMFLV
jgi:DNA-binding LytR/AlgR family response regulator